MNFKIKGNSPFAIPTLIPTDINVRASRVSVVYPTETIGPYTTWKLPVRVATTANITLTGLQTVDGISLIDGDRVLVKNQTTPSENGIYVVKQLAFWLRANDLTDGSAAGNICMFVNEGTTNEMIMFLCSNQFGSDITGTDNLVFVEYGNGGGGSGTPGGSNFDVQYNNSGAFGGSPLFTFNPAAVPANPSTPIDVLGTVSIGPGSGSASAGRITGPDAGTGSGDKGSDLIITSGAGDGSGNGGNIYAIGGFSDTGIGGGVTLVGNTGIDGGSVGINAGDGITGNGGSIIIRTGNGQTAGDFSVNTGEGYSGNGGKIDMRTSQGENGGDMFFRTGAGTVNHGGDIEFAAGDGVGIGPRSGAVNIRAGNSSDEVGGAVGIFAGSGVPGGYIQIYGGNSQTDAGGDISMRGGSSNATNSGSISITGGSGFAAGSVSIIGGTGSDASSTGGGVLITAGSGPAGGGNININAGLGGTIALQTSVPSSGFVTTNFYNGGVQFSKDFITVPDLSIPPIINTNYRQARITITDGSDLPVNSSSHVVITVNCSSIDTNNIVLVQVQQYNATTNCIPTIVVDNIISGVGFTACIYNLTSNAYPAEPIVFSYMAI